METEEQSQKSTSQESDPGLAEELKLKLASLNPGEEYVDGDTTYIRLAEPTICEHDFEQQSDGTYLCKKCPQGRSSLE